MLLATASPNLRGKNRGSDEDLQQLGCYCSIKLFCLPINRFLDPASMGISNVHVGPCGTFKSSGAYQTAPSEIDALFDEIQSSEVSSLVLYFHGGLVPESVGIEGAKRMALVFQAARTVPLSFVWETGLLETLRDNLLEIYKTELYQKFLKWLLRRVSQRFGGFEQRGAGVAIPLSMIEQELAQPEPFASYDDPMRIAAGNARGGVILSESDLEMLEAELQAEFQLDVGGDDAVMEQLEALAGTTTQTEARGLADVQIAKMLASIAYRVIHRHLRQRDHGFYPTVVEELLRELYLADLGAWIWGSMKQKAAMMWLPNDGLPNNEQHVGTYVLEKIAELQKNRPDFRAHLIGHSAGSIAICELLRATTARSLSLNLDKIVFMAPAGRSDLGVAALVRHPKSFKEFRCYTMADSYERKDKLVPMVYTRSLLYFISGVLEPDEVDAPIMGMMRHASEQGEFASGPAAEWAEFMKAQSRLVLSDSAELNPGADPGFRSSSRSHGDFDDDCCTLESLAELLRL